MSRPSMFNNQYIQSLGRILTGITLALVLYQLASTFATNDCQVIQSEIRSGGLWMIARLLFIATLASMVGLPSSLIAVAGGIFTGPFIGGPLASLAIAIGSLIFWGLGRHAFRSGQLPSLIDESVEKSSWFKSMMANKSISGLHWTTIHGLSSPIPYPFFGLLVGSKVRHLNVQSFIAGIFASSILNIAGYSLAGASVGCAVVNHALGEKFDQYRSLILVSCLILVLLSRLQSSIIESTKI